MKTKSINGLHIENMLRSGLANLCLHEQELNSMNVFPVADGDTGTNMRITLENGLNAAASERAAGRYLKALTGGMLFGARGNSGMILSQLFKGIYTGLSRCGIVNPVEWSNALVCAYKTAYASVVRPVEGTILTVAREGIENIHSQINRGTDFEMLFGMYIAQMRKSLAHTPQMLPTLGQANVMDSGALGYIFIMEGMLSCLYGEPVKAQETVRTAAAAPAPVASTAVFDQDSVFESGYCVEFVLQLMRGELYSQRFHLPRYISDLQDYGDSLVAAQEGTRVKVHIHTMKPAKVLALSQEFGEFVTCKVENMQVQHNTLQQEQPRPHARPFALICTSDSPETETLFKGLGCDFLLRSDAADLTEADFLGALEEARAETAVILPGSPALIHAALSARKKYTAGNVVVLSSCTVAENYAALAMYVADEQDAATCIEQLRSGITDVRALTVAPADGEYCAILDDAPLDRGADSIALFCDAASRIPEIEEKENCIIFRGLHQPAEAEEKLQDCLQARFPDLEINFIYGGSSRYDWAATLS